MIAQQRALDIREQLELESQPLRLDFPKALLFAGPDNPKCPCCGVWWGNIHRDGCVVPEMIQRIEPELEQLRKDKAALIQSGVRWMLDGDRPVSVPNDLLCESCNEKLAMHIANSKE